MIHFRVHGIPTIQKSIHRDRNICSRLSDGLIGSYSKTSADDVKFFRNDEVIEQSGLTASIATVSSAVMSSARA